MWLIFFPRLRKLHKDVGSNSFTLFLSVATEGGAQETEEKRKELSQGVVAVLGWILFARFRRVVSGANQGVSSSKNYTALKRNAIFHSI